MASRFVNISWVRRSGKTDLTAHIKGEGKERGKIPSFEEEGIETLLLLLLPTFLGFRTEICERRGDIRPGRV